MSENAQKNDFALLAVIDAYKWWVNSDYGFLLATGVIDKNGERTNIETGAINLETLRTITRAYSVARNIPKGYAEKVVGWLDSTDFKNAAVLPLSERADLLAEFCARNPVQTNSGDRTLASALSKLSWFMRPDGWTVFDKYVGAGVLRRQGAGCEQMKSFYRNIGDNWSDVTGAVCDAAKAVEFNPLLGLRIIDKYLFCHGLGMYDTVVKADGELKEKFYSSSDISAKLERNSVKRHRASLLSTEQALTPCIGDRLRQLASMVEPLLTDANWGKISVPKKI